MTYLPAALVALLLCASQAHADRLQATRSQRLVETAHSTEVEVKDGLAYYTVRRTFHNYGSKAEEARLTISLPPGAAATGLRIKGKNQWFKGELMHAERAEELYRELTGLGPSEPKDPALLYWRWSDELGLRVFPIFPGKSNTVEYTLTAPTNYADGVHYLSYGRKPKAANLATPVLRVRSSQAVTIDGDRTAKRQALGAIKVHPILEEHNIPHKKALVRPLAVRGQGDWASGLLRVRIKHTWSGDIALWLVTPQKTLISIRDSDLGNSENDLAAEFPFEYEGNPNGTWHLIVGDDHPLDGGVLTSWSLAEAEGKRAVSDNKPRTIPQPSNERSDMATIGIRSKNAGETTLRLGRVALTGNTQYTRLEVDVAEKLSKLPKRLSVTFVVDASYTMEASGLDAQFKLIDAYLSHVPDAEFSLVVYGRHAEVVTTKFEKAKNLAKVRAALDYAGKLDLRNGSFLERGIAAAAPGLAARKGSRALVLLTDDRLRPTWNTKAALDEIAKLPAETLVHVADVSPWGRLNIKRDDAHRLFPLAQARGGVFVEASGLEESKASVLGPEALYLVRPTRIDHLTLAGMDGSPEEFLEGDYGADGDASVLREGEGRRWMAQVTNAPRNVTLEGQLWSRPIRFDARANREPFNKGLAGFVFSLNMHDDLSDAEKYVVASYGGVVSPVTSFLAIEPGVRPSTIGLESSGTGIGGGGSSSGWGSLGHRASPQVDWARIIKRVQSVCSSHGAAQVSVKLSLQSREIADIARTSKSTNTAAETCVVETLWTSTLPSGSGSEEWEHELSISLP